MFVFSVVLYNDDECSVSDVHFLCRPKENNVGFFSNKVWYNCPLSGDGHNQRTHEKNVFNWPQITCQQWKAGLCGLLAVLFLILTIPILYCQIYIKLYRQTHENDGEKF